MNKSENILLYDGICKLCNRVVRIIEKHKIQPFTRYVSIQSEEGQKLLLQNGIDSKKTDTVIFIQKGMVYIKSQAIIKILPFIKFPWNAPIVLGFLPESFLNKIYDFIALNRYRIFGTIDHCEIEKKPAPAQTSLK